jgi:membrane associated rhomboid family serine protease
MASGESTMERLPPPATLGIISICGAVYFLQVAVPLDLQTFTMCPRLVLYTHEYYRILSSTVFHVNLMHIGMNALSTSAIGTMLEKRMGTLRLMVSIWWAMFLTSSLYVIFSWLAYVLVGYDSLLYSHAAGFSGVIFHMSVLETYMHPGPSRSLFGFISVPPPLYPWALLVLLQFIMPNISFLGHLAGILTGNLQYFGFLDRYCLMSETFLVDLEARPFLRPLVTFPTFVSTSQGSSGQYSPRLGGDLMGSLRSMNRSVRNIFTMILKLVRNVMETLIVCIFGRGSRINANIQLWGRSSQNEDNHIRQSDIQLVDADSQSNENNLVQQERESLVSRIV